MYRILLINNKHFFDKKGIITIKNKNDIPNKNAILFIGYHNKSMDNPNIIENYFDEIKKKPYNYSIIVGKGDGMLNKNLKIPKNIRFIYSNNIDYKHNIIKFLPMGSDFRSVNSFIKADVSNKERDILCYCNFSLNTHSDRKIIYNHLKNKNWLLIENMGTFLNYEITRDTFFERLGKSKFVICPRGNALDTFRFYDAIYAGAIPIVVKMPFHNEKIFFNVPILFLNSIDDFSNLTEEFLNEKYIELSKKIKTHYIGLNFNSLINAIHNSIKK